MNLKGRHFLSLQEFNGEELYYLISKGIEFKKLSNIRKNKQLLAGKTIVLLFEKPSTRTRISFEIGIFQLGGNSVYLSASEIQLSRGEPIKDTARVISRYADGIVIRTFSQNDLKDFAKFSSVPVINGLTDRFHPCQALADYLTILELKKRLKGIKLAFVGDGNNVANSLLIGGTKLGLDISIATPIGYEIPSELIEEAKNEKMVRNNQIYLTNNPIEACQKADVIYTDVWVSMGQENDAHKKVQDFQKFQVNKELIAAAKKDVIVMHCLPAHRGEEITNDVLEKFQNVIFEQAENRLHAQKALLYSLVG